MKVFTLRCKANNHGWDLPEMFKVFALNYSRYQNETIHLNGFFNTEINPPTLPKITGNQKRMKKQ